ALMKSVSRRELTPVTHRIPDIMAGGASTGCGGHTISVHAETIGTGALVLLLRVNCEITARCRLISQPDRTRRRHQTTVALHDVNVLRRQRHLDLYVRRVVRPISGHVVRSAANAAVGKQSTGFTAGKR